MIREKYFIKNNNIKKEKGYNKGVIIMKIKNNKLVNEYVGMLMEVYGDGEVGLGELMMGMYGWYNDESVEMLKKDMFEMYNIKIGVNEENESVYIKE